MQTIRQIDFNYAFRFIFLLFTSHLCISIQYPHPILALNKVLPHINPFSFDGDANFGDSVQLTCHVAKGDLPLKIRWLFKNQPIFAHLGILTSKFGDRSSFLTVPSVTAENSGNYTCIASNDGGSYNYTAQLNVYGRSNDVFMYLN